MNTAAARLSISLPRDLLAMTDKIAREQKISRSKMVSDCLRELVKKRFLAEMEEGYKAMAKENLEFASIATDLAHEVLPEWK